MNSVISYPVIIFLKIVLLSGLCLASMYPLCFCFKSSDSLSDILYKRHLMFVNALGGGVLVSILFSPIPLFLKGVVVVWKFSLLGVSRYYWKKFNCFKPWIITIPCLIGVYAFFGLWQCWMGPSLKFLFVLGWSVMLCGIIYCRINQ